MRNNFADEITKLAQADKRVVLLSGDIGNKLFDGFKAKAPDRFLNCGVAEANMMGMAAGLAMSGMRPVVYTIAPFTTTRVMEQIRVDVCYHDVPVVIVGVGSGLGYASLGATHHSCEDMAMLRTLPNMSVLAPADPLEVRGVLRAALRHSGPSYIRMGKKGEPVLHREVSVVSVKPLDEALLRDVFARFPLVASIEEHSLIGGFGAALAEWMADHGPLAARLLRFGTRDRFQHEAGETEHARARDGLTASGIVERITQALPRSTDSKAVEAS
jgi:transketolase